MKVLDIIYKVVLILYSLCLRCARYIKSRRKRIRNRNISNKTDISSNDTHNNEEVV